MFSKCLAVKLVPSPCSANTRMILPEVLSAEAIRLLLTFFFCTAISQKNLSYEMKMERKKQSTTTKPQQPPPKKYTQSSKSAEVCLETDQFLERRWIFLQVGKLKAMCVHCASFGIFV